VAVGDEGRGVFTGSERVDEPPPARPDGDEPMPNTTTHVRPEQE